MPVTMVTAAQCDGYASWRADREGLAWRLPWEWERQHAVRGADQRSYPWGEHLDPTWCQMYTTEARIRVVPVHRRTQDISCFGLCGGAGNVQEFLGDTESLCAHLEGADRHSLPDVGLWGHRWSAGGAAGAGPKTCMNAQRSRHDAAARYGATGMRLARFFSTR